MTRMDTETEHNEHPKNEDPQTRLINMSEKLTRARAMADAMGLRHGTFDMKASVDEMWGDD